MSTEAAPSARPRILDRYVLHDEIAAGGMATVHIARLLGTAGFSRTVAIKRLHPQLARDPEAAAMFLDEARLASRIRHRNVVQTLDVIATSGELFLVMEYVDGESLSRLLRACRARGVAPPPRVAAAVIAGVLHGLHAAHEARSEQGEPLGIVHRDVSPHNVLVALDGVPFVLDFGIAKATHRVQTTRDGRLKGKLAYMAPEQLAFEPVGRAADIYAASVVLWETLTGKRLFEADNDHLLAALVKAGRVAPPSVYALLPAGLDAIVLQGLSRSPADRFATARDMAAALERCAGLATPLEIAAWVDGLAGDAIRERARRIAEIEARESKSGIAAAARLPASGEALSGGPVSGVPVSGGAFSGPVSDTDAGPTRELQREAQAGSDMDAEPTREFQRSAPSRIHMDAGSAKALGRTAPSGRRAVIALLLVALTLAGAAALALVLVLRGGGEPGAVASAQESRAPMAAADSPPSGASVAVVPSPSAASVIPSASAEGSSPTSDSPVAAGSASAASSITQDSPVGTGAASAGSAAAPAAPSSAPASAAARAPGLSCDPPYTVDARGIRRIKRACARH